MQSRTHIYFASDFHLGVPGHASSLEREKRIVQWMDSVRHNAKELYLMGDLFDFWFEYRHVAPKGFVRLLGAIASFTDQGIPVHVFTGNHDMWMFGYLEKELNVQVHKKPVVKEFGGKKFYLAHGDGLGPDNSGYKSIKKIFSNPFFQWCYARLHPNLAFSIANYLSHRSRKANYETDGHYLGDDKEWLVQYCRELTATEHYDYMIFGHRHLPLEKEIRPGAMYINLGDWIRYNTYAVFDGEKTVLKSWSSPES